MSNEQVLDRLFKKKLISEFKFSEENKILKSSAYAVNWKNKHEEIFES